MEWGQLAQAAWQGIQLTNLRQEGYSSPTVGRSEPLTPVLLLLVPAETVEKPWVYDL